jgi:hypothetical protein
VGGYSIQYITTNAVLLTISTTPSTTTTSLPTASIKPVGKSRYQERKNNKSKWHVIFSPLGILIQSL